MSRWSNAGTVAPPVAVIVPATEDDIKLAIRYTRENDFKLVVAGGTHAAFVPITRQTVYVDMRKFRSVELDKQSGTVAFGGGTLTGDALSTLVKQGYYTSESEYRNLPSKIQPASC